MLDVGLTGRIELSDFTSIVGEEQIQSVRALGEHLKGKSVTHVNSTAYGGGVAEILHSMVPLMADAGLDVRWEVIRGDLGFFNVTKKIHNGLQGAHLALSHSEMQTYLEGNRRNSEKASLDSDIVMVHDAQPAALIKFYPHRCNQWIWQCHIDLSTPNLAVWDFIEPYIAGYNAAVFTAKQYVISSLAVPKVAIRPPSINPLSEKNRDLTDSEVKAVLDRFDIKADQPIITQVGRFDPWKNPSAAIDVYRQVKSMFPTAQLLLIGGMASDDPEALLYFEKTARHAGEDPDVHLLLTDSRGITDLEVNALQRASQVVLQMSTREGFGLTVAEALWKGVPVVGRKAGGIPLQISDGQNGFLVDSVEQAAERTLYLLRNHGAAKQMGLHGKEWVRKNFLIISHLHDYLRLFDDLLMH
ncbi:MAG: glycosyltransferase [Candidatus Bathyarchaeota archaeon]|nr:glycosyltransferase [Candidatus Bathyarchaeota archaeon]